MIEVYCTDFQCVHNTGGRYYGICQHPDTKRYVYSGGIDRSYCSTCKKREARGRIAVIGFGRNSFLSEEIQKIFKEEKNDRTENDRGSGEDLLYGM